jgi:hypothetical protein
MLGGAEQASGLELWELVGRNHRQGSGSASKRVDGWLKEPSGCGSQSSLS